MSEPDISALARRLAEQNNVDWRVLTGTGPDGRVVERDVLDYLARVMAGEEAVDPTPEPLPDGMNAWPDQDAPRYFDQRSQSARPSAAQEDDSPWGSSPAEPAADATTGAAFGETLDDGSETEEGADEGEGEAEGNEELSGDIFLFDDTGTFEDTFEEDEGFPAVGGEAEEPLHERAEEPLHEGAEEPLRAFETEMAPADDGLSAGGFDEATTVDDSDDVLLVADDDDLEFDSGASETAGGFPAVSGSTATPEYEADDSGEGSGSAWGATEPSAESAEEQDDPFDVPLGGFTRSQRDWGGAPADRDAPDRWAGDELRLDDGGSAEDDAGAQGGLPDLFAGEGHEAAPQDASSADDSVGAWSSAGLVTNGASAEGDDFEWDTVEFTEAPAAQAQEDGFEGSADEALDEVVDEALEDVLGTADTETDTDAHEGATHDTTPYEADRDTHDDTPDDMLDLDVAATLDEAEGVGELEALDGTSGLDDTSASEPGADAMGPALGDEEPFEPGLAAPAADALPLMRTGTVLRRHVDLSGLAAAQLAAALELGNDEPLAPTPFLLRAVARAAAEQVVVNGQVALAELQGELLLRRVDDAARRPFGALVAELSEPGTEEDELGLVAVDLSGFDLDEVLLDLDVPTVTLGRILYDTQGGAHRSTLTLTGDLPLERGAALLARVAELLEAPVRLLL